MAIQKQYDTEDLLDDILSIMTKDSDGLNEYIAAIEAEKIAKSKGLTPGLKPVSKTKGYFQQTWSDKIRNIDPAIFYGIEDVSALDGGQVTAQTYKVFVEVVLVDSGMTNDTHRRIARYSRALKQLFEDKFDMGKNSSKIKIETIRPIAFRLELDSSEEIKVGGVSLTITIV